MASFTTPTTVLALLRELYVQVAAVPSAATTLRLRTVSTLRVWLRTVPTDFVDPSAFIDDVDLFVAVLREHAPGEVAVLANSIEKARADALAARTVAPPASIKCERSLGCARS